MYPSVDRSCVLIVSFIMSLFSCLLPCAMSTVLYAGLEYNCFAVWKEIQFTWSDSFACKFVIILGEAIGRRAKIK